MTTAAAEKGIERSEDKRGEATTAVRAVRAVVL
jgi:hypothetical protein